MLTLARAALPRAARCAFQSSRAVSTLANNKHIYIFPTGDSHTLSLLPTDPPTPHLSIGTSTSNPPTPETFTENPAFIPLLQSVLQVHAHADPGILAQAQAFISTSGSSLGSGGAFFPGQRKRRGQTPGGGDGAGGASAQGGAGGGGRGGWVHLSDARLPPDFGRIAWPEDIFGSLQVGPDGSLEGEDGGYQPSGTYRIITREGILGLSDFLREKVVERLQAEEAAEKKA